VDKSSEIINDSYKYVAGAKLGNYDGSSCLDTFLAKFNNCAKFFKRSDNEQLFFLKTSFDGPAGQLLWHSHSEQYTVEKIIELLQNRFGQRNQAERYRAELRIRK
jgi:hypothetical protein